VELEEKQVSQRMVVLVHIDFEAVRLSRQEVVHMLHGVVAHMLVLGLIVYLLVAFPPLVVVLFAPYSLVDQNRHYKHQCSLP
jgi:hypothetical protein